MLLEQHQQVEQQHLVLHVLQVLIQQQEQEVALNVPQEHIKDQVVNLHVQLVLMVNILWLELVLVQLVQQVVMEIVLKQRENVINAKQVMVIQVELVLNVKQVLMQ